MASKVRQSSDLRKCRLCFSDEKLLLYIFEVSGSFKNIASTISDVLNYKISIDDQFPPFICTNCSDKLHEFKAFKAKCDSLRETYELHLKSRDSKLNCSIVKRDSDSMSSQIKRELIQEDGRNSMDSPVAAQHQTVCGEGAMAEKMEARAIVERNMAELDCDEDIKRPFKMEFEEDEDPGSIMFLPVIVSTFPVYAVQAVSDAEVGEPVQLEGLVKVEELDQVRELEKFEESEQVEGLDQVKELEKVDESELVHRLEKVEAHQRSMVLDRVLRTRKMIDYKLDKSDSDVSNEESSDTFHPSDQDDGPSTEDNLNSVRHFKRKVVNCTLTAEDQMPLSAVSSDGKRHSVANSALERSDKYEGHQNKADSNHPSESIASEVQSFTADGTKGSLLQNGPISFSGRMINSVPEYSVENEVSNSGNNSFNETAPVSSSLTDVFECEETPDVVNNGSIKTREALVGTTSTLPSTLSTDSTSPCISLQRTSRDSIQEKQLKRPRKEGSIYEGISMIDLESFGITLEKETDDPGPGNERRSNPEGEPQPLEQNAEKDRHMQSFNILDTSNFELLGSLNTAVPENVTVLKVVASSANPATGPDNRKKRLKVHRKTDLVDSDTSSAGTENKGSDEGDSDGVKTVKKTPMKENLCEHCGKVFLNRLALWHHRMSVHIEKKFECKKCSKMFNTKSQQTQHYKTIHSDDRPFSCTQCGSRFKLKTHLKRHMLVHSRKQMYQCIHCEMGFRTKWQHDSHQASHEGEVVWSCDGCKEKSKTWAAYQSHLVERKKNIMYKCDICSKAFNIKKYLGEHILCHIKQFQCSVCGKHFGLRKILNIHMRVHTGEKPYVCNVCGKMFSTHSIRRNHFATHSDARPFKCRFCDHRSKTKSELKRHENRRMHKNHK